MFRTLFTAIFCLNFFHLSATFGQSDNSIPNLHRGDETVRPYREIVSNTTQFSELGISRYSTREKIERSVKATALIDYSKNCSGVFISKTGHLLTALHCLHDNGFKEFTFPSVTSEGELIDGRMPGAPKTYSVLATNASSAGHSTIKIRFAKQPRDLRLYYEEEVELIYAGRAFPVIFPKQGSTEKVFETVRSQIEDFAIVKLKTLPLGYQCVSIAKELNPVGQPVWLTGFPKYIKTPAEESLNLQKDQRQLYLMKWSDAWEKGEQWAFDNLYPRYVSTGYLYSNYEELLRVDPTMGKNGFSDKISNPDIFLVTSAPSMGGMSGGGTFTADGKLAGITTMKVLEAPRKYDLDQNKSAPTNFDFLYGTSLVTSKYIYTKIFGTFGEEATQEIFSCD